MPVLCRVRHATMAIANAQLCRQAGDALSVDRLLHHSHTILVQGDGYRLKQKHKASLVPKAAK
jgi:hypothetical protein